MSGILIIKLGALGDIIMACPLIRRIQECHAGAEVHLLTGDSFRSLFSGWPELHVQSFARHDWRSAWRTIGWIRSQGFARIYDLQSSDRSGILCALSGVRDRVGNHPRFPYSIHPPRRWRGDTHIHERWAEVLRSAGLEPGPLPPWLPISESDRIKAEEWLRRNRLAARSFAVLHAGTSPGRSEKRWPRFGELAAAIIAAGINVVWAGGPDDFEVNRTLARQGGIDASGAFSLPQLAALGTKAQFAVTNDSAPMHALACAGIPVFGLFGPSDWRRNHAIGQAANVISAGGPATHWVPAALDTLPPARVVDRLRDMGLLG
ncbi:MAG: glycosyltransferase family 9 protein [Gammaproteobacteria bacterium]|nr:glycosyltransferase family 9 protein [Gammaproteobacteria bacterium]